MIGKYIDFFNNISIRLSWDRVSNVTLTNLYHDYTTFKDNVTWIDIFSIGLAVYVIMTFRSLVEWYIKSVSVKSKVEDEAKAIDCGYKCIFRFISILLGARILFKSDCDVCFSHVRHEYTIDAVLPLEVRVFYIYHLGYYLHGFYAESFLANPKTRFQTVMMHTHHVVSFTLAFSSYAARAHDCGIIMGFLHDISDIILEGAKFLVAQQQPNVKPKPQIKITMIVLAYLLPPSWCVCRLYLYPMVVITRAFAHPKHAVFTFQILFLKVILILNIIWSHTIFKYYLKLVRRQWALMAPITQIEQQKAD